MLMESLLIAIFAGIVEIQRVPTESKENIWDLI